MDLSIARLQLLEYLCNFGIAGNIALEGLSAWQFRDQVFGLGLQPLVLIADGELCAGLMQLLHNGPGDTALVGHPKYDGDMIFQVQHEIKLPPENQKQVLVQHNNRKNISHPGPQALHHRWPRPESAFPSRGISQSNLSQRTGAYHFLLLFCHGWYWPPARPSRRPNQSLLGPVRCAQSGHAAADNACIPAPECPETSALRRPLASILKDKCAALPASLGGYSILLQRAAPAADMPSHRCVAHARGRRRNRHGSGL